MPEEKRPENQEPQGWKDVQITPNMPLDVIVNFMNILNQRLCSLENVVTVIGPDKKMISLTDLYAIQAEEAKKQQEEMIKKQQLKEELAKKEKHTILADQEGE